jgi:hypothetical protein
MDKAIAQQIKSLKTLDKIRLVSKILMMASSELEENKVKNFPEKLAKASGTFFDLIDPISKEIDIANIERLDDVDIFDEEYNVPEIKTSAPFPHLKQGEKIIAQWEKNKIFWEKKAVMEGKGRSWKELYDEYQLQNQAQMDQDVLNSQANELKTVKRRSFKGIL